MNVSNLKQQSKQILLTAAVALFPALGLANNLSYSSASKPAVAWSSGSMRVNGTEFVGSANVLPGQSVEMQRASGQLYLADGSRLRLGASTRFEIGANALSLSSGAARVDAVAPGQEVLPIRAGELEIRARAGVVNRTSDSNVVVSASTSPMEVRNQAGTLIAMVRPGQSLAFAFGKATAGPKQVQIQGVVEKVDGKYFITDKVTQTRLELQGKEVSKLVGKTVKVQGQMTSAAAGQTATLTVQSISVVTGSALSSTAVITGVVVTSGAVAGTTLALVNGDDEQPISN